MLYQDFITSVIKQQMQLYIFLIHSPFDIFFLSLQPSAAQLFWMWSVPGQGLGTAATTLSPQQDAEACQSYKQGFRKAADNNRRERRARGRWRSSMKRGEKDWGSRGRRCWQAKIIRTPWNCDIFNIKYTQLLHLHSGLASRLKKSPESRDLLWMNFAFISAHNNLTLTSKV